MTKKLKSITQKELLGMLDPANHERVKSNSGLWGVYGFVVFENMQKDSHERGLRTVITVGPLHTHKTIAELHGAWLGEGASRKEAVAYCLATI